VDSYQTTAASLRLGRGRGHVFSIGFSCDHAAYTWDLKSVVSVTPVQEVFDHSVTFKIKVEAS